MCPCMPVCVCLKTERAGRLRRVQWKKSKYRRLKPFKSGDMAVYFTQHFYLADGTVNLAGVRRYCINESLFT